MMCITPNTALKHKFIVLLFLLGSILYAQETESTKAIYGRQELQEANLVIAADKEPSECLEYSGYIVNKKTGNPIAEATVEVKNSNNGLVTTIRTDETGYYNFIMPCDEKNKLVISALAYSKETRIVRTGESPKAPSTNNRIYLTPFDSLVEREGSVEKIKVDPIYYESNKSTTNALDKIALKKVLFTMLTFPEIRIKIESHSNAGGSNISNAVISYFRTKAARRYLILQGIDPTRIESANGHGIDHSEGDGTNGFDCDDQELLNDLLSDFIIVSN